MQFVHIIFEKKQKVMQKGLLVFTITHKPKATLQERAHFSFLVLCLAYFIL